MMRKRNPDSICRRKRKRVENYTTDIIIANGRNRPPDVVAKIANEMMRTNIELFGKKWAEDNERLSADARRRKAEDEKGH